MSGEVKVLQFSEGVSTGAPTQVGVTATNLGTFASDAAYVTDKGSAAASGDTYYNTTVHKQRIYTNGTWRSVADLDKAETFSNKSFDTVTNFTDTTQSTTKDNGSVVIEGGIGVEKNLNVGGNAIITGDLTVNGTTTTINTATLDVEDANITVNKNGNQATANSNVSGFKVEMSDATHAQIGYDSSLASKFKAGNVGSEAEVVTVSHTQNLSNKTFTTATAFTNTTQSTDKDTGAITTEGGVGIEKNLNVGGDTATVGGTSSKGGSASSPGYSFNGDPNTGILSSVADTVSVTTNGSVKLSVDANGRIGGSSGIMRALGTSPDTSQTTTYYIESGTFSPTITGITNITTVSSPGTGYWMRVANAVTFWGEFTATGTTGSTLTQVSITIPIASTFNTNTEGFGFMARRGTGTNLGSLDQRNANDDMLASWVLNAADAGASRTYAFHCSYFIV